VPPWKGILLKAAYFQCIGGASGDMTLGALVDAGLPLDSLSTELAKLPLHGYKLSASKAQRQGVTGTKVDVDISHEEHEHRSLRDILSIIEASTLSPAVKDKGAAIFQRLAAAEASVHGVPIEKIHFHEVGAVDAIVDIMGSVIGLSLLSIEKVYCSSLPSGIGAVRSEHGMLTIPAPGTAELIAMAKAPLRASSHGAELVTPTGAAIMTTLASFEQPTLLLERVGYGLGRRDMAELPNVLCVWIGELSPSTDTRDLVLLETNIDNMSPEVHGHVMERLFALGVNDVWFTPIQMKKGRPAVMLSVLAAPALEAKLSELLFLETTTLGIRSTHVRRHEVAREVVDFLSSLGPVKVKLKLLGGKPVATSPEFESCRQISLERSIPFQEVYRIISAEASSKFLPHP